MLTLSKFKFTEVRVFSQVEQDIAKLISLINDEYDVREIYIYKQGNPILSVFVMAPYKSKTVTNIVRKLMSVNNIIVQVFQIDKANV